MGNLWVFTVPSIRRLTNKKKAYFDTSSGLHLQNNQRSTSLEELVFLDSHVQAQALKRIVKVPRALRKFVVHQHRATFGSRRMALMAYTCCHALVPAHSTLETIICDSNILDEPDSPPGMIADMLMPFKNLKYLGLDEPLLRYSFTLPQSLRMKYKKTFCLSWKL